MTEEQAQQQDVKPQDSVQHINLKVVGADSSEIAFKIKRTTPLSKLMAAYIQKTGQDPTSVRFLFEGTRVNDHDTPESLDMEDDDQIQVLVQQLGGKC